MKKGEYKELLRKRGELQKIKKNENHERELNKYLSNCVGFILAATSNYFLNRIWTFESHKEEIAVQYLQFMVVSTVGLGINSLVLYLLTDKLKWNFYFSKLIAIGITTVWNFFANMAFTFA